jgi:phosphoribosylanthranilate isomerase
MTAAASGPLVKICGLVRPEDARLAASLGAAWVGVVLVPGTPRARTAEHARALGEAAAAAARGAGEASDGVSLAIVVADPEPAAAAAAARASGARALQLHGSETPDTLERLRDLGDWELWKALRVRSGDEILPAAERWAGAADLLLLDGWHPDRQGGTGTVFDWDALEAVRDQWPAGLRLGVAGGLRPENVAEACVRLRPHLVDTSSGVEAAPGQKDPDLLQAFLAAVQGASTTPTRYPGP